MYNTSDTNLNVHHTQCINRIKRKNQNHNINNNKIVSILKIKYVFFLQLYTYLQLKLLVSKWCLMSLNSMKLYIYIYIYRERERERERELVFTCFTNLFEMKYVFSLINSFSNTSIASLNRIACIIISYKSIKNI